MGSSSVFAVDVLDVPGSGGTPFFRLHVYNKGEGPDPGDDESVSGFTLNEAERAGVVNGLSYWVSILSSKAANKEPLNIAIVTDDEFDDNASASSDYLSNGYTRLSSALVGNPAEGNAEWAGNLALIVVDHAQYFEGEWYTAPMSSLPGNGEMSDLPSTLVHEMMHALGLASNTNKNADGYFFDGNALWNQGLRDADGKAARQGMIITVRDSDQDDGNAFVTNNQERYSGVYFTGAHVEEVLQGALLAWPDDSSQEKVPGLPVNGWEYDQDEGTGTGDYSPEFSHIELQFPDEPSELS